MGLLKILRMTTQQELQHYTGMLQQMTEDEIVHKYFGNTLPYRWEVHRKSGPNELIWLGTILLDGSEVSLLYALSIEEQRVFLRAKLAAAIGHC